MKSTGIVRKVDELGRVVIPIELRRTLGIAEKDALEIYVDDEKIILKKYPRRANKRKFVKESFILWCQRKQTKVSVQLISNLPMYKVFDKKSFPFLMIH